MRKTDAIAFYGSVKRLAEALDVRQNTVSMYGEILPKGSACELEVITSGALRVDWSCYPRKHPITTPAPKAKKKRAQRFRPVIGA